MHTILLCLLWCFCFVMSSQWIHIIHLLTSARLFQWPMVLIVGLPVGLPGQHGAHLGLTGPRWAHVVPMKFAIGVVVPAITPGEYAIPSGSFLICYHFSVNWWHHSKWRYFTKYRSTSNFNLPIRNNLILSIYVASVVMDDSTCVFNKFLIQIYFALYWSSFKGLKAWARH